MVWENEEVLWGGEGIGLCGKAIHMTHWYVTIVSTCSH